MMQTKTAAQQLRADGKAQWSKKAQEYEDESRRHEKKEVGWTCNNTIAYHHKEGSAILCCGGKEEHED